MGIYASSRSNASVGFWLCLLRILPGNSKFNRLEENKNCSLLFFFLEEMRLRRRPRHMLHFDSLSWRSYQRHLGLGELMPFFSPSANLFFLRFRGLKGNKDQKRWPSKGGRRRPSHGEGPLEAQPLCGLRHVRHETQLTVYSVSSLLQLCFYFL